MIGTPTVIEISHNRDRAFDKFGGTYCHLGIELSVSGFACEEFEGYKTKQRVQSYKSEPRVSHPVYCTSRLKIRLEKHPMPRKVVGSEIERLRVQKKCPKKYTRDINWTEPGKRSQEGMRNRNAAGKRG
jgi:hypothetical protein